MFTEDATIRCRHECSVGARMEAHPAVSIEQEGTSHCFIRDDVYPYSKGRGRFIVVVKLDG